MTIENEIDELKRKPHSIRNHHADEYLGLARRARSSDEWEALAELRVAAIGIEAGRFWAGLKNQHKTLCHLDRDEIEWYLDVHLSSDNLRWLEAFALIEELIRPTDLTA